MFNTFCNKIFDLIVQGTEFLFSDRFCFFKNRLFQAIWRIQAGKDTSLWLQAMLLWLAVLFMAALENQGFTLTHIDEWSADAKRGSSGTSVILGAFAGKKAVM